MKKKKSIFWAKYEKKKLTKWIEVGPIWTELKFFNF